MKRQRPQQRRHRTGRRTMKELPQFLLDLLAATPSRGGGLNLHLFRLARLLWAFRTENEIIETLRAVTAGEPIRRGEIERAVARSKACAWTPGKPSQYVAPAWPEIGQDLRQSVIAARDGLADLWESSPVRIEDDQSHTEEIIDQLFSVSGDPLLCAGRSKSRFDTCSRNEWRGKLSALAVIVPNPMTARRGLTQEGKESAHALSITGARRTYLVVEQDSGSIDEQSAVLLHLAGFAPLVLAVHSGSKSIHGWFACGDESEQTLRDFMNYAVQLGADHATWCRSQFVRMPDGRRETGEQQRVFYFDPEQLA
jgi:hypothetical protein